MKMDIGIIGKCDKDGLLKQPFDHILLWHRKDIGAKHFILTDYESRMLAMQILNTNYVDIPS